MLEREREAVADAARCLAAAGLAPGTAGNVSARHGELVAVTRTGATLETVSADEVAVVDLSGALVQGPPPSSELALHLGTYQRYGAGAVTHIHGTVGTALACVIDELPAVHYQMVVLGGSVRVARYATFGTTALAEVTLDALADREAVLMANHGALTYGDDLASAVQRAKLLEWVCTVYWQAAALGTPRTLSGAQLAAVQTEMDRRRPGGRTAVAESR
jgi:L-fuculose-phosphate aldolase